MWTQILANPQKGEIRKGELNMSDFYCFSCEELIAPSTIKPGMRCPLCGGRVKGTDWEYRERETRDDYPLVDEESE